ncbi:hypothetical protein N7492_000126 [Penicillium capsulatum]|uniref:Spindle pole body component n=1 Tax=Penicillium capsulatum TaxID=69766 RepID=A0A9W9IPU8_9EURO|nr:hypothetical protein N7492_000126 [Penicillium capsulatum]KAJ6130808.1 hypothetical protein N7512_003588 [Penicillium capsulatum]
MALAVGALTDALITAVAHISPEQKESPRAQRLKRRVQGALRPGSHARTNQFAVARQLEGLQEKFQVVNRDELAHALHARLVELGDCRNDWLPELLNLLLQLSDRPVQNSKIEDLQRPVQALEETQPLSWSDFNTQDTAFSSEDIWEEVDFAAVSSDDGLSSISSEGATHLPIPKTPITPEKDYVVTDEVFVSGDDEELITSIENAQFWKTKTDDTAYKGKAASKTITELQFSRETIFMLQGLPTSIFWRLDNSIEVDRSYTLDHSSNKALSSLLRSFTEIGSQIDILRNYTQVPQGIPYMQTFCRGIESRLQEFDGMLSKMQGQYLSAGAAVSLLQLLHDLRQSSRHLVLLSDLVCQLKEHSSAKPTRCIDLLYDHVCMLEALGDDDASRVLATLFFSCFKTYTRSIQLWMETGQVDLSDSAFFVRNSTQHGELRTLWHDWFVLDESGQKIPHFLENGVHKVFTTGKNMVFLDQLTALPDRAEVLNRADSILDDIYPSHSSLWLPFSALVESAFDRMIEVNHSFSAGLLRSELEEHCGLWESLDALHHVYLGKDLSMIGMVDTKIFGLMDRGRSWDDRFLITELIRSAFGAVPTIDTSRLVVRSGDSASRDHQDQSRSVRVLEKMSIDYVLPWPIANIITQNSIHSYRRVATFLMQIRRAKYVLVKQRLRDARGSVDGVGPGDALIHALHHNILWFLDVLYSHLAYLVIATTAESQRTSLSNARDIDAMIAAHQSYMSSLENQCLLSVNLSPIHEAIVSLLDLAVYFADLQTVHASGSASQDDHLDQNSVAGVDITRRKRTLDDESDSDEDEDMDPNQTFTISFRDSPYDHQMRSVKHQFVHLINFITDGLKGVARAEGLPSWNILAERLEWRKA